MEKLTDKLEVQDIESNQRRDNDPTGTVQVHRKIHRCRKIHQKRCLASFMDILWAYVKNESIRLTNQFLDY